MHHLQIDLIHQARDAGFESWCQQVCNCFNQCGRGRVCIWGIDPVTELPAEFEMTNEELTDFLDAY